MAISLESLARFSRVSLLLSLLAPLPCLSQLLPSPVQEPKPAPAQPTPALPDTTPIRDDSDNQPHADMQVRTGSVLSGAQQATDTLRLTNLLDDHQYLGLESLLQAPIATQLTPTDRSLLKGVLAARENRPHDSIAELASVVANLPSHPLPPQTEKLLRRTLAEDYLHLDDFSNASENFNSLARSPSITPEELDEIELPLKMLPLVAQNPGMTVEYGDPFSIPYDRDPLGLMEVPVFVDAHSHDWLFDPTAPFNLISRSSAHLIGLKLSEQTATVRGITGRPIQVHSTIIPRLTVGDVTYRNVTAFVYEDADYFYPHNRYQIRGVLGYPAISALGSITVTQSGRIEVQPGEKGEHLTKGARFFLDGEQVLVTVGKPGEERIFQVDASGQQTYLTSRYFAEHTDDFAGQKTQLLQVPGSTGKAPAPAYMGQRITLLIGSTEVTLPEIQVLTDPLGSSVIDPTYGVLGMDLLDELKSYTFDYRTMRFAVETEAHAGVL